MPKIVLVNPEIPPNTGNIARTCAATATELHLVEPLGFELSDRYLKRAGLDYWPHVNLQVHPDLNSFGQYQQQIGGRLIGFTTKSTYSYIEIKYQEDDWLLFGSESEGLPRSLLETCEQTAKIPMLHDSVRSLNLSVSAAIGLFEALRQLNYLSSPTA
ncbi:tRNA (cytidine(34)-2'-O)-methyltransferase [Leptolyngbyaceae cyanobacterium CCMR0082]|uniref:Putative tRNA (cytidine(34)-2'-O)-methyltransferase n=2 Tax=Adonisia turfae TaxID=2950184 RepID=A0A6M0S2Y3_9CYAN|nr:tRNA (cytidine(34)-2'-O)-methyltransferase [Adonisia turfae]MDV3347764.1 tRNA (cytidine(34)-2'-O)-methyltransferase [Leptothoe sp. LEGE 181152]NEZ60515.1 tRNA (cytidine(34)-2'-O)-methyltransferase [Adonisia turfae CCMR0081]NEZ62640.1 tRNA (cytidine(34)-2'-O)-methyltransferase [Adonisia turfae CCMR0082]